LLDILLFRLQKPHIEVGCRTAGLGLERLSEGFLRLVVLAVAGTRHYAELPVLFIPDLIE
jgi:hypothetical protein